MLPRGIRNNNPGNIEKSATPWQGKVAGSDPRFETFDTAHNGIRALAKNILAKRDRARTIRQLITIWAPPVENDTDAYVQMVAASTGIEADAPVDFDDRNTLAALTTAIIRHENGQQPYSSLEILAAVDDALGRPVQVPPVFMERERARNVDKLPANIQEPKQMGGLAAMLVQTLIGAFAPLAQEKINAALAKHGVGSEVGMQLVGTILNAVQPGLADAPPAEQIAAVAAAQKDTAVMAKAEASALDLLQTLAPLMDKSVGYDAALWAAEVAGKDAAAARARNERWDMTPTVVYFAAATLTGLVFALLGALLYQAVSGTHTIDSGLLGLAGPIFMAAVAAWGAIIAYRFDGTKDSSEQTRAMLRVAEGNSNASVR